MSPPIITLTTDFGTADGYVGAIKGVLLGICPQARLVDLSHAIAAQDVAAALAALEAAVPYFPPAAVHPEEVEPGVGSRRRALALRGPEWTLVGPDNGVCAPLWQRARERHGREALRAVELTEPAYRRPQVSATFHGRDVFAPAAAHLAAGLALERLGPALAEPLALPRCAAPQLGPESITGTVLRIDRFGNCITDIPAAWLERLGPADSLRVRCAGRDFGPPRRSYADVAPGAVLALIGSRDELELALRNGDLAAAGTIRRGTPVRVERA